MPTECFFIMPMNSTPKLVDIPFEKRHLCWFCEEPCHKQFSYFRVSHTPHASLTLPVCSECLTIAEKNQLTSIWDCRVAVKDALMHLYRKDLAIGINWTEQELAESEFSCRIFEGFKKSAWNMYQIALGRINAKGWPLSIDGKNLAEAGEDEITAFEFDGLLYTSLSKAISHYSETLSLDRAFLQSLTSLVGKQKFGYAIRLARLNIGITKAHQQRLIDELKQEMDNADG